ncbi:MAG TPA: amino acid ABC transporter substrate-binding protein [Xanthobacteraceae bacterium]|nr:amino acid ABC transporter substrate-binding protein [Xanthobacteraceae bacterium]
MFAQLGARRSRRRSAMLAAAFALFPSAALAQSGPPITIGYGISQTGGLAPNGKSALLAQQIWEEDINAKGGLLGRPVKLVYYDDQTNPATVPGLYQKLLDVDKVDIVIGGYGTNLLAPAMPVVIQKKKMMIGLFGMAVNTEFNYPKYFSMIPLGPTPKSSMSEGFFQTAVAQNPKPETVAIVAADAEFPINGSEGARENIKKLGLKIVYDKRYPPATTDFAPIVRAIQAANPDIVAIFSYPPDSVGFVRAINEIGYKPKMIGCGMVGLQATAIKTQLGPLLNGFVNYDFWLPIDKMNYPGVAEFMKRYQARAGAAGVDPLGYYIAPWGYAQLEVLGEAITATKSLDDDKLADYIRVTTFKTLVGDVKFGAQGEWAQPRVLQVQFQHIKGNDIAQFRDISTQVVVTPPEYKSGDVIYPYANAK